MLSSTASKVMWGGRVRTLAFCVLAVWVAASVGLLLTAKPAHTAPNTFQVNSRTDTADANPNDNPNVCDVDTVTAGNQCTLRAAIQEANNTPNDAAGPDTITFNIPDDPNVAGDEVRTISPTSGLPQITEAVLINGYTQSGASANTLSQGNDAALKVELNGTNAGTNASGLLITASNSTIKGLVINRFGGSGIFIIKGASGATGNKVEGNFIGTDASGTADLGNTVHGVSIENAANNTIGGTESRARNVISGNGAAGVQIITTDLGSKAADNKVQGNFIGTKKSGTEALGNTRQGVLITSAPNNTIGGTEAGAGNVISGTTGIPDDIFNSEGDGVEISGIDATGNKVEGNFIGTNASGTADLGNNVDGVQIENAPANTIGGTAAGARNVISGHGAAGVTIFGNRATNNNVLGNFIGTNASGSAALGNGAGVRIESSGNLIGGTAAGARNIISGNANSGVSIVKSSATGNRVQGNFIGTNASGTADLGNGLAGALINSASNNTIGGTDADDGAVDGVIKARNIISGNGLNGVHLSNSLGSAATGNKVLGNLIGTDVSGTAGLFNGAGVEIEAVSSHSVSNNTIGGTAAGAHNVISGNRFGLQIDGDAATDNRVQGNLIGTDVSGSADLGNNFSGVSIFEASNNTIGGTTTGAANVISGNDGQGVQIDGDQATGNEVLGNFIGTTSDGTGDLGNDRAGVGIFSGNNIIGGTEPGAGNVISGNGGDGVSMATFAENTDNTKVEGNFIGTNADGSGDLGNTGDGVEIVGPDNNTIGGTVAGARNVISGNGGVGIKIRSSTGNKVEGNLIGTNASGSAALGNSSDGVRIESVARNNTIGGTAAGAGNVISGNDGDGVAVDGSATEAIPTSNTILSNRIFSNGGLGIDLIGGANENTSGVTPNDTKDPDTGANNLQNFPVIDSVRQRATTGDTAIEGRLNSTPSQEFTIQCFVTPGEEADPSDHGEGQDSIAEDTTVTTDLNGNATFDCTFNFPQSIEGKEWSATAINEATGDTSEFSLVERVIDETNDPPVNSVPGAQSTNEDSPLVFSRANGNRISVFDPDAGTSPLQVRLQVDHATLTLNGTSGLKFAAGDGTNDVDMTFIGSRDDVNAALDGMRYTPEANYNGGATLAITTDDQGNTGGGGAKSDTDTVSISVNGDNDAPTISNIANKSIEKDTSTGFIPFTIGDVETLATNLTLRGTSSNTTLVPNANISFGGSGTNRMVKVTPAAGKIGTATITVRVSDGSGAQASDTFVLTVQDTKAPRVIGVTPAHLATGISPAANVLATFSEAMKANTLRNPDTLRSNTFTLVRRNADGSTTRVAATVSYSASTKKATLNPSKALVRGATYVATLTTGAKDVAGNALDQNPSVSGNQSKVWTFKVRN